VLQDLVDIVALLDITIQHVPDQVDTIVTDGIRHTQVAVHDLVYAVEGVLLVDDGVQQDTQRPDILFLATVGFPGQDLGGGVVCDSKWLAALNPGTI
jgi:5-methylcytosine-specific restriction endonuclease McrBC regulatory subunit McrC